MSPIITAPTPQSIPPALPIGDAEHFTFEATVSWPLHELPWHDDVPIAVAVTLALMCVVRKALSAVTHCPTSVALTY
jgi:hypothetical protein